LGSFSEEKEEVIRLRILNSITKSWHRRRSSFPFSDIFLKFQEILTGNQRAMEIITDLGEKGGGEFVFDRQYLRSSIKELSEEVQKLIHNLNIISRDRYIELFHVLERLNRSTEAELKGRLNIPEDMPLVIPFKELRPDYPEVVGGKVNTLGVLVNRLNMPVPEGFVITTAVYQRVVQNGGLEDRIHECLEAWIAGKMDETKAANQIKLALLSCHMPRDIEREIQKAIGGIEKKMGDETLLWALRSSAYEENEEWSFAGVFDTFLNVPSREVPEVYKKVIASLFSPQALIYRQKKGLLGEEPAMAVACQQMINSRAGGVAYSLDIQGRNRNLMRIQATLGLGRWAVEGSVPLDSLFVSRGYPFRVVNQEIVLKERKLIASAQGGEREVSASEQERLKPALSDGEIKKLADMIMTIERFYKRPQDVEWCVDADGRCWILQSRSLMVRDEGPQKEKDLSSLYHQYPILIRGKGTVVHQGIGAGAIHKVTSEHEMNHFPEGGILVSRYTAPWLARILPKAGAVITERGSPTGHMATVAREFRIPTLVEVEGAFDLFKQGDQITVDTEERVVYNGLVKELIQYQLFDSLAFEDTREFRLLRRILKRIAPLNLVDPHDSHFSPSGCRTYHDIVRFVHEKAVSELTDIHRYQKSWKGAVIHVLQSTIPLGLVIVDIGGGLVEDVKGRKIGPEKIASVPFRALWKGLSSEGAWKTTPVPIDFRGMMSSLTRTFSLSGLPNSQFPDKNLVVLAGKYMNMSLMLGYHFSLIDAYIGEAIEANYIYFRFVGGVSDVTRRSRRARFLAEILTRYGFKVNIKGDLVVARLERMRQSELEERLEAIGRLIGFSRQLDVLMQTDQHIQKFVDEFFGQEDGEGLVLEQKGDAHECNSKAPDSHPG
jgi:pyruvate,water dikinase